MYCIRISQEVLDARPFDTRPSLVVPTEQFPFPTIVVVMACSPFSTYVGEDQELAVVFHDPRIPGTAFGRATYTSQFLDIGAGVPVTNRKVQH